MSRNRGVPFVWDELRPLDEPGRHRRFWVGLVCALVLGTPWWAEWLPSDSRLGGLPAWVALVLGVAFLLSTFIALSALLWWRDVGEERDHSPGAEIDEERGSAS